jgi:hypothetical protein
MRTFLVGKDGAMPSKYDEETQATGANPSAESRGSGTAHPAPGGHRQVPLALRLLFLFFLAQLAVIS